MARPRSFDQESALAGVMHVFRQRGYERTSISDLEKATGLSVGSLYNAFGGKASLFQAAFAHYVQAFAQDRLNAHLGPGATVEDLEGYVMELFAPPLNDGFGCLITNSVMGADSDLVLDASRAALRQRFDRIREVLERELDPADASAASSRLELMCEGLLVIGRAQMLTEKHAVPLRAEFAALRQLRRKRNFIYEEHLAMSIAVNPETVASSSLYSQGVEVPAAGRMLFISGQVGMRPDGAVPDNVEEQTRQANYNLQAVLAEASMQATDVVKSTIYLTDREHIGPFMEAGQEFLTSPPAATTLLIVDQLADPRLFIEIEAIAVASS